MKKLILFFLLFVLLVPVSVFAANDGTPYGGVTFGSPKYGSASASFDGIDDYVEVSHNESLNFGTNSFTFTAWFKTSYQGFQTIHSKISADWQNGWQWDIESDNIVSFNTYSGLFCVGQASVLADGNWHFLAVTVEKNGINVCKIWADGNLIGGNNVSLTSNLDTTAPLRIGTWSNEVPCEPGSDCWLFNGLIDEVAIYNVALSPETITSHYNSTNYQADVSNTPGLVSYWRFDNDFLDAPVSSVPLSDSELLQQIKDVLDQIDAKTQAIKDVTAGSTAVDWNKTMSFVVGTLSSLAFVFASRMIL